MHSFMFDHMFSPFHFPFAPYTGLILVPLILGVIVWTVAVKGFALWHAARNAQKEWFIALLIINTLGILELVYLFWFRADKKETRKSHHDTPVEPSSPA